MIYKFFDVAGLTLLFNVVTVLILRFSTYGVSESGKLVTSTTGVQ
jgi:hypothetical protein